MTYKELLQDSRWKEKRLKIIKRDNYKCQYCHNTFKPKELQVHHKEYHYEKGELVDPWDYDDEFLITLCKKCHKKVHNIENEKSMAGKLYQNVFKNIFEYHTKGMLNDSEFCELMDLIYYCRWDESKYDPSSVSDKVKIVWQALEPTIEKSKTERKNKGDAPKDKKNTSKKSENSEGNWVGIISKK